MTLSPYRRDRRSFTRRENTQHLIVFRIRRDWFALPIRAAYKVILLGSLYGTQGEVGLTRYRDQDVIVIDIQRRIFGDNGESGDRPTLPASPTQAASSTESAQAASQIILHANEEGTQRHLLLLQSSEGELIGIPLNEFPSLRHVPESAFTPVPRTYLAEGGIRCVSALVTLPQNESPVFLLNLNQLIDDRLYPPAIKNG